MLIELDNDNNRKLRLYDSYVCLNYDLTHIETEVFNQKVKVHSGEIVDFPVGSRSVYRVNDKRKFMLIYIATGIKYREISD